jgi:hypothetical protein
MVQDQRTQLGRSEESLVMFGSNGVPSSIMEMILLLLDVNDIIQCQVSITSLICCYLHCDNDMFVVLAFFVWWISIELMHQISQ